MDNGYFCHTLIFGLIPVAISAFQSLLKKKISVDLLAAIALTFSLLSHEWTSAAFITLMLAFARSFDHITEVRAKRTIQGLMKYHVENVRIRVGQRIIEVHVSQIKKGDEVIVDSGDRMPVDGIVISGQADIDESSLTGESELVSKKAGDRVFTSTVNESGSLIVRTDKVGKDTTLSHIIDLDEESSRNKGNAEQMANRFTQWYIGVSLVTAVTMYVLGLSPKTILAVLLVVCADDIAVAVPLGFTAAIVRAARRGVIIKGSAAFEQLSRMKYILTDKTGTLTRGKPKVVDVKTYGTISIHKVIELGAMGASESGHAISHAIIDHAQSLGMTIHAPHESHELSGQGMVFSHGIDHMCMGRLSFMDDQKIHVSDALKKDIQTEKDAGLGVTIISLNGEAVGLISYSDELRPHVREIIDETKTLGIKEWHMLTGDNEKAAASVATEIGITHVHANMTPETKVAFVKHFEQSRKKGDIVAYMGDGVNDAASLALADVSIAMGGIGSDAAIEAADITIMKDNLSRLPEVIRISHSATRVMWQNFGIWAITNIVGLSLVGFGLIGPVGAATYNFLTDFLPIGNALRAGKVKR